MKFTCSMVPAPPSPWTTSMLFMVWGKSFGIRLPESRIRPWKMREGAIGHVNSCLKLVTPMFGRWENLTLLSESWGDLHQFLVFIDWILGGIFRAWIRKGRTYWRFHFVPLKSYATWAAWPGHQPHVCHGRSYPYLGESSSQMYMHILLREL